MAEASPSVVRSAIRATFNASAPYFDAEPLFFWDVVGRRTVELADIAVGSRVLDVCCGTGASAIPAATEVGPTGSVLGVDLADRLLARARAKAHALRLANVEFVPGDMEYLDLPDAGFDVVVCVLGLYYAQDPVRALAELWRVLRPGGTLAVTVWGERSLEPAQTQFLRAVADEQPDAREPDHARRAVSATRHLGGSVPSRRRGRARRSGPGDDRAPLHDRRVLEDRARLGLPDLARRHGP